MNAMTGNCGKEERRRCRNSLGRHMGAARKPKCRWSDGVSGRIVVIAGVLMEHAQIEAKIGSLALRTARFSAMGER